MTFLVDVVAQSSLRNVVSRFIFRKDIYLAIILDIEQPAY